MVTQVIKNLKRMIRWTDKTKQTSINTFYKNFIKYAKIKIKKNIYIYL